MLPSISASPSLLARGAALLAALALAAPAEAQIRIPPQEKREQGGDLAPHAECSFCGTRNYQIPTQARRDANGNPIAWCPGCKRDTVHLGAAASPGELRPKKPAGKGRLSVPPGPAPQPAPEAPRGGAGATGATPSGATSTGATPGGATSTGATPDAATGTGANPSGSTAPAATPGAAAPTAATPGAATPTGAATDAPVPAAATPPPAPRHAPASDSPAAFVFAEMRRHKNADEGLLRRAVDSLVGFGEDGLAASRAEIASDEPAVLVVAARTLLRGGVPSDIELVKTRARAPHPGQAGPPLVDALSHADPVHVPPRFLVELVDTAHAPTRAAAERAVRRQLGPDLYPALEGLFGSRRAEVRLAAAQLARDVADPEGPDRGTALLLAHLADPSAKVASTIVGALAERPDPELEEKLVALAFHQRWILRENAYALVALVEREDRFVRAIFDERHVDALLGGLAASDPFVAGASALALSGVGFRSGDVAATAWLDREVVDRLVLTVSGKEFHTDFTSIAAPALRRLRLVSGQELGADGPRWVEWWLAERGAFRARRARLEVAPDEVVALRVRCVPGAQDGDPFVLLAPEAEPVASPGEALHLRAEEARDLLRAFENEGALGPERLPGVRGSHGPGERLLAVAVGSREKAFVVGPGSEEPWFDRLVAAALAVRDQNRWQRYPHPQHHASARDLWREQQQWWGETRGEAERALRLKALVFDALPSLRGSARDRAIAELERLYAIPGVVETRDFAAVLGVLAAEPSYSERVARLSRLASSAARVVGGAAEVPAELGLQLADALDDRFGPSAREDLAAVALSCGRPFVRQLASAKRPSLRAVAASALSRDTEEADVPALVGLLEDPDPVVEAAAVRALGRAKVESARTELLVRARLAPIEVRTAALEAIGELGGDLVLDALVLGLASSDPPVRLAAANGLATLADRTSAPLFVSMLSEGSGSPVYAPARAGLVKLGLHAWPELLRVVHSPAHRARRDAAILLAEQGVPQATSALITLLTANPRDAHVASELAVLSGVDLRGEADPANAWWSWWDGVVHDDSLAWFRAACERATLAPPAREAFDGAGSREARLFLTIVLDRQEPHLVERARRELGRMLGRDLGPPPPRGTARAGWIEELRRESVGDARSQ